MARQARAAMSDLRALEEQHAAANPIVPSRRRKTVKGGAAVKERATVRNMANRRALEEQMMGMEEGTGATPTMGLSVARGGRKKLSLKRALAHETPSLHNAMEDEIAEMPSGEYDGGKHTLMDHLSHPMKGFGDYLHALEGGLDTGRYQGEGYATTLPVSSQFRGGATTAQKEKAGREYRIASLKAHKLAHKALSLEGGMMMGQVVGGGKADKIALVVDELSDSDTLSDMEGGALRPMMCDDMPEAAAIGVKGRKKRAPAGPDDGRRKRAEVVKRVMADRGLSMIEASKYVKAHNLYPGSRGDSAGAASGPPKRPPPGRPSAAQAAAVRRRAAANPGGPEAAAMM